MYQMLCVLLATIAYGIATGHCQGSQAGMTAVTFQSSTYSDMRQGFAKDFVSIFHSVPRPYVWYMDISSVFGEEQNELMLSHELR